MSDVNPLCQNGHDFQPFIMESIPPTPEIIDAVSVSDWSGADDVCNILTAITTRRYAVICARCGMFGGGFKQPGDKDVASV